MAVQVQPAAEGPLPVTPAAMEVESESVALEAIAASNPSGAVTAARVSPQADRRLRRGDPENIRRDPRNIRGEARGPAPVATIGFTPVSAVTAPARILPADPLPTTGPGGPEPEAPSFAASLPRPADTAGLPDALLRAGANIPPPRYDDVVVGTAGVTREPSIGAMPEPALDLTAQKQVVLEVLNQYRRAYERLDVQAAKAVQPSLNEPQLKKAFSGLDGHEIRFADCQVSIAGPKSNARCQGEFTYRPKAGRPTPYARGWTFNLARHEDGWQIVNATLLRLQ